MHKHGFVLCALAFLFGVALAPVAANAQAFNASDHEQRAYVEGNLFFLGYHEVGHMILDQVLDIDQQSDRLSSEEVADDIATWLMLPDADEPEQDEYITAAIEGWSRSAGLDEGISQSPHYPDDATRAARIACYLYGSNPNLYPELAELFSNSIASVDCGEEVEALHEDLISWLGDHFVEPGTPPGERIQVTYEQAGPGLQAARAFLMQSGVLEDAAEDISQFVRLPNEVELVAASCGAGAAEFRYSPSARRITACYEAVDWLMKDASGEEHDLAVAAAERGDEMGSGGARVPRRPRPPGR